MAHWGVGDGHPWQHSGRPPTRENADAAGPASEKARALGAKTRAKRDWIEA